MFRDIAVTMEGDSCFCYRKKGKKWHVSEELEPTPFTADRLVVLNSFLQEHVKKTPIALPDGFYFVLAVCFPSNKYQWSYYPKRLTTLINCYRPPYSKSRSQCDPSLLLAFL